MTEPDRPIPLLIAGLGNFIMRDDGVGVHVAHALADAPPPGAVVAEVGTAVLDALHLLESASTVVAIDAVDASLVPGTIVRFEGLPPRPDRVCSLHDFDLAAVLRLMHPDARPRIIVLGVQPAVVETGLELSEEVAGAVPRVIEAVHNLVAELAGA